MSIIEKWKKSVDKWKTFAALLTDLYKVSDCLPQNLIDAKLDVYGFSFSAVWLIQSYFSNRKQGTKINSALSSWKEILFGVLQGSILGWLSLSAICFQLWITQYTIHFFISNKVAENSGSKTAKKLSNCFATSLSQFPKVTSNWGLFSIQGVNY